METGGELRPGSRGIVGRILLRVPDDLFLPVVLTRMHLFEIRQFPEGAHRSVVNAALGLADPPHLVRAAARRLSVLSQECRQGAGNREDAGCNRGPHHLRHQYTPSSVGRALNEDTWARLARLRRIAIVRRVFVAAYSRRDSHRGRSDGLGSRWDTPSGRSSAARLATAARPHEGSALHPSP